MVMMLCSNSVWLKIAFFKFIIFRTTKNFCKSDKHNIKKINLMLESLKVALTSLCDVG